MPSTCHLSGAVWGSACLLLITVCLAVAGRASAQEFSVERFLADHFSYETFRDDDAVRVNTRLSVEHSSGFYVDNRTALDNYYLGHTLTAGYIWLHGARRLQLSYNAANGALNGDSRYQDRLRLELSEGAVRGSVSLSEQSVDQELAWRLPVPDAALTARAGRAIPVAQTGTFSDYVALTGWVGRFYLDSKVVQEGGEPLSLYQSVRYKPNRYLGLGMDVTALPGYGRVHMQADMAAFPFSLSLAVDQSRYLETDAEMAASLSLSRAVAAFQFRVQAWADASGLVDRRVALELPEVDF